APRIAVGIVLVLGLGIAGLVARPERDRLPTDAPAPAKATSLRCAFRAKDTAAFTFSSTATLEGRATEDRVEGVLRWMVVDEGDGDRPAVLRAALGPMSLKQGISEEKANAAELVDRPFYVRIDPTCRLRGLGFSPRSSIANRHLVESLFESSEIVLP